MGETGAYCPKCGKFGAATEIVMINDDIREVVLNCDRCGARFEWAKFRPEHVEEDLKLRQCPLCGDSSPEVRTAETNELRATEYKCSSCSFRVVVAQKK